MKTKTTHRDGKMRKIIILLISTSIVLMSFPQNSLADCEPDGIDSFLEEFEQKLPYLEKEVELMIKMLSSKKHLVKIKQDLKAIKKDFHNTMHPQDTHFFRALKAFNLSPDQLTIAIEGYTYQLSDVKNLQQRLFAGGCSVMYPTELIDILPDLNPNQMEKIAELMNRTIETLTPFYLMAKEKISNDDFPKNSCDVIRYGFRYTSEVYCVLGTQKFSSYLFNFMAKNPQGAKNFFIDNKIPNSFLEMLKNYFKFLTVAGAHPRNKSWKFYTNFIDEILAEKAESGDMFGVLRIASLGTILIFQMHDP